MEGCQLPCVGWVQCVGKVFNALIHVCSDGLVQGFEPAVPELLTRSPILLEVGVLLPVHALRANELFHVSTKHARGEEPGPLTAQGGRWRGPTADSSIYEVFC